MLVDDFNKKYGFQNRLLTFHPDDNGKYYILEKIDNNFFLYDINGNPVTKKIRFKKEATYHHNIIIKETKDYFVLENNFNFEMNGWNHARMSLNSLLQKYNGKFLGNLIANEYNKTISSNFFGQNVIPVCVFNSSKDNNGNTVTWRNATEQNSIYEKMTKNDPWIMFFKGNDDSSYYAHFHTCFQTIEAWEMARLNDNKMPEIIKLPRKEKHPEEYYQLQTSQELFLFHQN